MRLRGILLDVRCFSNILLVAPVPRMVEIMYGGAAVVEIMYDSTSLVTCMMTSEQHRNGKCPQTCLLRVRVASVLSNKYRRPWQCKSQC